jgi:hypothetical protein
MAPKLQVAIDAADPRALGSFWCAVLDYIEQPPPDGFVTWEEALTAFGVDMSDPNRAFAIVDPAGEGPRFFFAKVPEGKSAKNRLHLDVNVGAERIMAKVDELIALGATLVGDFDEPAGRWVTLRDPEGNEFCLQ